MIVTAAGLWRRLDKLSSEAANETRIFYIDSIGPNGAIPHTKEQIEILKAEAVAQDPYKDIYIIELPGGWMS